MCMNIETSLAVTKRWAEEESTQLTNSTRSKILKQRQLGLLRGNHAPDAMTRGIRAAKEQALQETKGDRFDTNGRENRYPVDTRRPSLLSREKLRMLRQIRSENAGKFCASQNQERSHSSSSTPRKSLNDSAVIVDVNQKSNSETGKDKLFEVVNSIAKNANEDTPSQKNILHELRQRSKYLPALLKEFKKLEVKCEMDQNKSALQRSFSHPPSSETSYKYDGNNKDTLSGVTCATILAAIRTTREKQRGCRALSAPRQGKPPPEPTVPEKPRSSIPRFRQSSKYTTTSSGVLISPGASAVYTHVPTPPAKDFKVHWNRRMSPNSSTPPEKSVGRRVQKPNPTWVGRIRSADGSLQSRSKHENENTKFLSCSHINLHRAKTASRHNSYPQSRQNPNYVFSDDNNVVSPEQNISSTSSGFNEKKKVQRSVRFSDEEDKVFEYKQEEPIGRRSSMPIDEVFTYQGTLQLRRFLDEKLKDV